MKEDLERRATIDRWLTELTEDLDAAPDVDPEHDFEILESVELDEEGETAPPAPQRRPFRAAAMVLVAVLAVAGAATTLLAAAS